MTTSYTSIIKKLLILFLVITGLYYGREFLIPLAISAVIATLFLPFCKKMESKRVSRGLATSVCLFVLLLFIAGIGILLGWQISELTNDITLLKQRAIETSSDVQEFIFKRFGITLERQSELIKSQKSSVDGMIHIVTGSFTSVFTNFFLTIVYIFGLLYYRRHIKIFLLKFSSPSERPEAKKLIYSVALVSQQYLLGLSKMIVCLWIMYSIGFSIVGVKNAIFFAILCGLLEIVPFVGNLTGSLVTVLVSVLQGASAAMVIGIICTYGIIQFIQGWVLEPIIVGSQVKINPLFIIIALVIGELVWGIPGVFLAIPLIAIFKIVSDHIEPLKPYGFLVGEVETKKRELSITKKMKNWLKEIRQ
jgi:predicted PurR-regulated permease PerM